MKKTLTLLIAAAAVFCGCISTSLNSPPTHAVPSTTDDNAAIRKLYADDAAALSAGDMSALAMLYEQDSIQLPPASPAVTGWPAIRAEFENGLKGIKVAATIEVAEVCIADSWAFARGTYRMVTIPLEGGQDQVTTGNWLDILRRQSDNSWKIARSTWSDEY